MRTPRILRILLFVLVLPTSGFSRRADDAAVAEMPPIIGGTPVEESVYPEIVRVRSGSGSFLTGVIVGPRVLLSAAHGIGESSLVEFEYRGRVYQAMGVRSPLYPEFDHDLAVAVTFDHIRNFSAASISKRTVSTGEDVQLLGFGCTDKSGSGTGMLHAGEATVIGQNKYDWISKGVALCFGDSGGPAYPGYIRNGFPERKILGIGSKGNIKDMSYFTRVDSEESKRFFDEVIASFDVTICGINAQCHAGDELE